MQFDLPEYREAYNHFTDEVIKQVIRTQSFLGSIYSHRTIHAGPVRNVPGENPIDHSMTRVEHEMTLHHDVIRESDIDSFGAEFLKTPASVINQLSGAFVSHFEDIVDRTGNVFDAGGRPFDFDQYLTLLESWDMKFGEAGNPDLDNILILASPGIPLAHPAPSTDDQRQQLDDLIERKRAAFNAKKRSRRLS
jgi:hypothetical protein